MVNKISQQPEEVVTLENIFKDTKGKMVLSLMLMYLLFLIIGTMAFRTQYQEISSLKVDNEKMNKQYIGLLSYIQDCQNNGGTFKIDTRVNEGYCNVNELKYEIPLGIRN